MVRGDGGAKRGRAMWSGTSPRSVDSQLGGNQASLVGEKPRPHCTIRTTEMMWN